MSDNDIAIFQVMSFFFLMKTFSLILIFFFQPVVPRAFSNDTIAKPRIVGGYTCDVKDTAPFAVGLYGGVMCGGTLVSLKWILTAAHCLTPKHIEGMIARVGFNSPSDLIQERQVVRSHRPDDYDISLQQSESDMRFDIGLVSVDRPFDPSPVAQVAKLPEVGDTSNCRTGLAVGVGLTSSDEEVEEKVDRKVLYERPLMCVELPLTLKVEDCRNAFKTAQIDDTVFCGSASGKDTCLGDSGGPLICDGKVIGVISYGPKDCGSPSGTAIYTKVESYLDFIKETATKSRLTPRRQQVGKANDIKHFWCRWNLIFILALVLVVY